MGIYNGIVMLGPGYGNSCPDNYVYVNYIDLGDSIKVECKEVINDGKKIISNNTIKVVEQESKHIIVNFVDYDPVNKYLEWYGYISWIIFAILLLLKWPLETPCWY